ncbi:MAG: hypothetical protein JW982_16255 [Spirochaetes bacterium]|nr:hypothetical protein [Spirochaetota bacterium]
MKPLIKSSAVILILLFTACVAPIIINYENKFYTKRKSNVKIIPFYGDINQIYYYQQNLPVFNTINLDEKYMYYNNNSESYKSLDDERSKVFYIIISTRF